MKDSGKRLGETQDTEPQVSSIGDATQPGDLKITSFTYLQPRRG